MSIAAITLRPQRRYVFIWLIAIFSATGYYGFNRLALVQLHAGQPIEAYLNGRATVVSPDDEYYVTPPENWLAGREWRRSPPVGRGSYVRRTPGYSIWYLVHRVVVGPDAVFMALLVSQIIVFGFAAVAFAVTLKRLVHTVWIRRIATAVFILSPWFLSYSFFSITEALSVPLLVFELYFTCRAYQANSSTRKAINYAAAILFFTFATLTRPFSGLSIFLLATVMIVDYLMQPMISNWKLFFQHTLLAGIAPLLLFGTWIGRNYLVTNQIVLLEQYSHPESLDGYKPAFNAAWDLYAASGVPQVNFYNGVPVMYGRITNTGKPDAALIEKTLIIIPADKRTAMGGDERLRSALQAYQQLLLEQYYPYISHPVKPMPSVYSAQEAAVVEQFTALKHRLYQAQPKMRIIAPMLVVKEIVAHSNTSNLALFDQQLRNKYWPLNLVRLILLSIHLGLYAGLFASWWQILRRKSKFWQVGLVIPPTVLIVVLSFWVGTSEQRYLLPFLSFLLLNAALLLDKLFYPATVASSPG